MIRNKQIFHVSSYDSKWSQTFQLDSSQEYDYVVVLAASIPKSWYLIQSGYNTFTLKEGASSATVTLTAGNYTATNFITEINSALNTASPNHWTYSAAFSSKTAKYTWTVSGNGGNGGTQPQFLVGSNVNEQLGFAKDTTVIFSDCTLKSANTVNFQLEPSLFLHSSLVGNNSGDNVLQQFYSQAADFSNIAYKMTDLESDSRKLVANSTTFNFYLTDENGTLIDLNGQNIVMTLMFWKKDNFHEKINKYLDVLGPKLVDLVTRANLQ